MEPYRCKKTAKPFIRISNCNAKDSPVYTLYKISMINAKHYTADDNGQCFPEISPHPVVNKPPEHNFFRQRGNQPINQDSYAQCHPILPVAGYDKVVKGNIVTPLNCGIFMAVSAFCLLALWKAGSSASGETSP